MITSAPEHQQAIERLIAQPADVARAERVFELAQQDPPGSERARQERAPAPALLPLDLVARPFRRHNLSMPDTPATLAQPRTLAELLAAVQAAADAWLPVKAIGDGYGFANTGETRGCLISMVEGLNRVTELDRDLLKSGSAGLPLCQFQGGATLRTITKHLWQRGQAVLNQPGYEKLTFVGTMSSGGHGSGSWCGPLSEHVRALHIVTLDSQRKVVQMQIEPANGLSNPVKFRKKHPEIELIQDDRMFHACSVGVGCLGVIYSVIIEVRAAYYLHESRRRHPWSEIEPRLPSLLAEQGPGKRLHSIEVWVNPYRVAGDVWCVLGERAETRDAPRGHRALAIEYGGPEFMYRLIAWWAAHHPEGVPALIHTALGATQAADVVLPAPEGLEFGATNLAPVTAAASGVPSADIGNLVNALITFFQKRARDEGAYITSPIGLRFVKAARAHLSPAFGRDTCMIEVPTLLGTPHARQTLTAYHDFLSGTYGGRPHWGQVNDMPAARLAQLYPNLNAFLESFRVLNPKGFFDNAFTEQLGLRR
jgi:D-arabinono-1,4-lactone oxidase/FAD binding domain-containing protein